MVVAGKFSGSRVEKRLGAFRELRGLGDGIEIPDARRALEMLNGCFEGVGGTCAGAEGETSAWSDFGGAVATLDGCLVTSGEEAPSIRLAYDGI